MTKDHFKEPLPPGVKNLDNYEIDFPEHNLEDYVCYSNSRNFSISITYDERHAFKKYVESMRDFYRDEAFGKDPLVESLVNKICYQEVSK